MNIETLKDALSFATLNYLVQGKQEKDLVAVVDALKNLKANATPKQFEEIKNEILETTYDFEFPTIEEEQQSLPENEMKELNKLIGLVIKECTYRGYLGVELDNLGDEETEQGKINIMFNRILFEYDNTKYIAHELEEDGILTEAGAQRYTEKLGKFVKKYAHKFIEDQEQATAFVAEVK